MVALITIDSPNTARAENAETETKLHELLGHWQTVNLDALQRPENADVLQALKAFSKEHTGSDAQEILIKLNDQETVNDCLNRFRHDGVLRRVEVGGQILRAGNPRLILMLIPDLNKVESAKPIKIEDVTTPTTSVQAAEIIQGIIKRSDSFPAAVRVWAKELPTPLAGDELREAVRSWWKLNQAAIKQGNYQATVVPTSP